jgi:hypothetical protein
MVGVRSLELDPEVRFRANNDSEFTSMVLEPIANGSDKGSQKSESQYDDLIQTTTQPDLLGSSDKTQTGHVYNDSDLLFSE